MSRRNQKDIRHETIQVDASGGPGHHWLKIGLSELPSAIVEEISAWYIEDKPKAGDEMKASNGQTYRLFPGFNSTDYI